MAPQVFAVDQAQTFGAVLALAAAPKTAFGTDQQETAKDGRGKWEVQLSAGFHQFGKLQFETIKVSVLSNSDPLAGVNPGTPVQLVGFQVGVMDKTIKDRATQEMKVVGAQVWYRAEEVRPISAAGSRGAAAKSEAA